MAQPTTYGTPNIFWVPREARWSGLQANAKQSDSGQVIAEAMPGIESYAAWQEEQIAHAEQTAAAQASAEA